MISEKLLHILLETLYSKKNTMTSESMSQNTLLFHCLLSVFYHRDKIWLMYSNGTIILCMVEVKLWPIYKIHWCTPTISTKIYLLNIGLLIYQSNGIHEGRKISSIVRHCQYQNILVMLYSDKVLEVLDPPLLCGIHGTYLSQKVTVTVVGDCLFISWPPRLQK